MEGLVTHYIIIFFFAFMPACLFKSCITHSYTYITLMNTKEQRKKHVTSLKLQTWWYDNECYCSSTIALLFCQTIQWYTHNISSSAVQFKTYLTFLHKSSEFSFCLGKCCVHEVTWKMGVHARRPQKQWYGAKMILIVIILIMQ